MACRPKAIAVHLSEDGRAELERMIRRRRAGQALVQHARIVLACAEAGSTNAGVARALGVGRPGVTAWRQRFLEPRRDGLVDALRPGAPRRVGEDEVERPIALALETQPNGAMHRPTRAMEKQAGLSQAMASRVRRAFGLAPHRQETCRLSTDPAFADEVGDVVGLHLSPPDRDLVLWAEESEPANATGSRAQASGRSRRSSAPRLWRRCDLRSPSGTGMTTGGMARQIRSRLSA